jgi:SAM-dependent methyltransferase
VTSGKFTYLSYRRHRICNPFAFEALELVLGFADLKPGELAFDLGAGNGVISAWLAQRYGLAVSAVERFEPMAQMARNEAAGVTGPGRVEVVLDDAVAFLNRAPPCRLLCAIGTVGMFTDAVDLAGVLARLKDHIGHGGYLLWGDPFWKAEPSDRLKMVFARERYQTHEGYLAAAERAGMTTLHAEISSQADWDAYSAAMVASVEDWLAENPDDPDAPAFRTQIDFMRTLYEEDVRAQMGFGLYLFRVPA